MLRTLLWLMLGLVWSSPQTGAADEHTAPLASLTAAERAFAATTAAIGVRNGFLTFFADDAVALEADGADGAVRLVPARDRFLISPEQTWPMTTVLSWAPYTGQISGDGAVGWLTGAYVNRNRATGAIVGQGAYFSVWRRQADGTWRVWLDQGVPLPRPWTDADTFRPAVAPDGSQADDDLDAALRNPLEWATRLAPTVRLHRQGLWPIVGAEAVAAWRARTWSVVRERTVTTETARARDMAIVLSSYVATGAGGEERGVVVRVWQRAAGGRWEIVFETSKPVQ